MGCCGSKPDDSPPSRPMQGGQTVGREQGRAVNRDEQRERAAAAAEARATTNAARGQTGSKSKMHVSYNTNKTDGRVDVRNPAAWN